MMSFRQLHIPQTFSVHKGSTPDLIFLPCSTFTQSTRFLGEECKNSPMIWLMKGEIILSLQPKNVNVPDARLIPN